MRTLILLFAAAILLYSCLQISAKDLPETAKANPRIEPNAIDVKAPPDPRLRVGKIEVMEQRKRRGNDDASLKISVKDLQSLMSGSVSASDSFVFYFVRYKADDKRDENRYKVKVPHANWLGHTMKKPSSLLVGFVPGNNTATGSVFHRFMPKEVALYDLSVVCPPPPDCNCIIAE